MQQQLGPTAATYRDAILEGFVAHDRPFPWRAQRDPYGVLIGEVLLQRTRGENAVDVYRAFLRRWPDPTALSRARVSTIERVIRPLGLIKRARILKQLGAALADFPAVPDDPDELDRLPGVGPYAAHSVPVFAYDRDLPVVDWVIARVLRRYFGLPGNKRPNADRALWELAGDLVTAGSSRTLWLGTLDFAAAVCTPRPKCPLCPLRPSCATYALGAAA